MLVVCIVVEAFMLNSVSAHPESRVRNRTAAAGGGGGAAAAAHDGDRTPAHKLITKVTSNNPGFSYSLAYSLYSRF